MHQFFGKDCVKASSFNKRVLVIVSVSQFMFLLQSSSQTLSLDTVLSRIEKNNSLLASYQHKINASQFLAAGAKSWSPPIVGIGFDQTPYSILPDETFFNRKEGSAVVFVEQEISNPKKRSAEKKYFLSLGSADSLERLVTQNQLFTEAKIAYIERFIAEKKSETIEKQMDILKLIVESSKNEYATSEGDLSSIYKAEARLLALEAMQIHEKSAVNEATVTLNYLMNVPLTESYVIDSVVPLKNYTLATLDTAISFISNQRSDIQVINSVIASGQLKNNMTLFEARPDFGIRYEHYDMFGSRNSFSLSGQLTIPIAPWSSKGYKSTALSMQEKIQALNLEKQNLIRQSQSQLQRSLLHTLSEYSELNKYIQQVLPAYRKAFETSLFSFRENTGSLLNTLMALEDYSMAEMEYIYHLEQAYKSEIEFENAIEKR